MARSRPAQGANSRKAGSKDRPAYKSFATPKVVSRGTASRPKKLAKWNPSLQVDSATPRQVQAPL